MPPATPPNVPAPPRQTTLVLQAPIDVITWPDALARIERWAAQRQSRTVCICNAHSVVTATQDPQFLNVLRQADMATPDGAPVAWMMRRLGHPAQQRINGPDLMLRLCERAAASGTGIYLLGCTPATLAALQARAAKLVDAGHPVVRPPCDPAITARSRTYAAGIDKVRAKLL